MSPIVKINVILRQTPSLSLPARCSVSLAVAVFGLNIVNISIQDQYYESIQIYLFNTKITSTRCLQLCRTTGNILVGPYFAQGPLWVRHITKRFMMHETI